ncbi:hypothetical protein Ahy_A03g011415 [Arachis hypogaea]|uniref:PB1-like domain-containing protein n=1 Tax=Arachis hypogaea TaxID=3818 RepID=A0A445DQN9_ARAHY|nr:hypothetical protein Ahy_A03g011415 [Arachis hypogaea]
MNDLVKDIGYTDVSELYWLEPGKELDGGLKLLRLDMDVVTMYEAAIANGRRVEVFTEHPINLPEFAEEKNEPEPEEGKESGETEGGMPGPDTQTEDDAADKDVHATTTDTQSPKVGSDQPNVPTHSPKVTFEEPPRIIPTPDTPTEPNLPPHELLDHTPLDPQPPRVSVGSEETGYRNPVSAESVAPTVDNELTESNEVFTQYIPQPYNEPDSQEQSIQNENETPCEGSQPSSSQPESFINPEVGGGNPKKRKRRSTVRPPLSGQTFIPNQDPNKHPSIFIPVEGEDMSEATAGMHCYESEELDSVASDDEDSQQATFPQANPDAPVREVRLERGMDFENLEHFKKAVRKFNINIGRSIFFPRVDSSYGGHRKKDLQLQMLASDWLAIIQEANWEAKVEKGQKKNDAPKEPTPDPHRAPRKYGPITCKYCLKTGHNSRSCSKKKEAMAGSAGEQSASQHPPAADDKVEAARLEETFWKETLEAIEVAEAAATQPPPETTPVRQPIPNPAMSPPIRPPTTIMPPKKKKNVRRPPPTSQQPRPPQPTLNPTTPTRQLLLVHHRQPLMCHPL